MNEDDRNGRSFELRVIRAGKKLGKSRAHSLLTARWCRVQLPTRSQFVVKAHDHPRSASTGPPQQADGASY
ncbi:hypothetical protein H2204_014308 [Knufia peltigerae]|uniref:Uncharacterized protein n=1 Tax=Knufia peltigerae TaxID=1002370 RepID=A0AA38XK99_9EURO|nr:hypothetical protein H2204_014308 [Knufia peltigerae]